ncbi:haloalkane dehalogenase [Nonomuraea turcica]|uniref:haloalkane dehalogenase n=1 Tax=Nonomuraea sp. G32 TaxID=3067274 RepID=UPI00273A85BC|nr:haloalkane dehalogenase [Nonomuraea sp. G32]MDP4505340.1 haloalkane dehalogenase [Nonomuraea sp. G32]
MNSLRTPDERFDNLPDYPFASHYTEISGGLRVHYVDERPDNPSGETILLLHGEPTWSYLYRRVIPPLVAAGHRCVAPDLVGFGRSDKPAFRYDYTYQAHVDWLRETIFDALDLRDVTLVCHDWGGMLGLRLLAEHIERFRRVIATNTLLPTGDSDEMGPFYVQWLQRSQRIYPFKPGEIIDRSTLDELERAVQAAYNAPFPDESYLQGARQFPLLAPISPDDVASEPNRAAWAVLEELQIPFLCAYGEHDMVTGPHGKRIAERIPGATHVTITNASHFLQEDQPQQLAQVINTFIATPSTTG